MINKPPKLVDGVVTVNPFEDIQKASDGLIVGCMNSPGPIGFDQLADDLLQFAFHDRFEVGPRLQEILEVGSGPDQVFTGAVDLQHGIALTGLRQCKPARVVGNYLTRLFGEQAVCHAHTQVTRFGQLSHNGVVVRKILSAAAGIRGAGHPESIEFAHVMP